MSADLIASEKPEILLHAAAMTNVDGCERDRAAALSGNFEATKNVTDAANRQKALLVFFGTDFVFDGVQTEPYKEEDAPHPINVYGQTKLLAERYVLCRAKRYLILRSSWLFGTHGNNFPKKVLKQAGAGKALRVVTDQVGNPTFTRDLAQAVVQILNLLSQGGKENQVYHITNEGAVSRYELARLILMKKGYSPNLLVPVPSESIHSPAARPKNSVLSTEKIKNSFGIRLRPWQEAVEAYLGEDPDLNPPRLSPEESSSNAQV
jgi:dTDP-4-dehydrorhamnose reductase